MTAIAVIHDLDVSPAGFPDIDPTYARCLRSTDKVEVDYDASTNDDGSVIIIRRTVWTRGRRSIDRKPVWIETAMELPRGTAPDMVKYIVACLVA